MLAHSNVCAGGARSDNKWFASDGAIGHIERMICLDIANWHGPGYLINARTNVQTLMAILETEAREKV